MLTPADRHRDSKARSPAAAARLTRSTTFLERHSMGSARLYSVVFLLVAVAAAPRPALAQPPELDLVEPNPYRSPSPSAVEVASTESPPEPRASPRIPTPPASYWRRDRRSDNERPRAHLPPPTPVDRPTTPSGGPHAGAAIGGWILGFAATLGGLALSIELEVHPPLVITGVLLGYFVACPFFAWAFGNLAGGEGALGWTILGNFFLSAFGAVLAYEISQASGSALPLIPPYLGGRPRSGGTPLVPVLPLGGAVLRF